MDKQPVALWQAKPMVQIRRAITADIPALLPLIEAYWASDAITGFDPGRQGAALETLLLQPQLGAGWIAESEGRAVGYLLAVTVFSLEDGGLTAEIDELYVLPAARNRGVGARLLAAAEAAVTQEGCRNLSLQVGRGNDAARRFYHRHGFGDRAGFDLLEKTLLDRE